jgi:hypothetical protein
MDYAARLLESKQSYPFVGWRASYEEGLEQYTEENCEAAKRIMDTLLSDLIALGEDAREEDKMHKFQVAVEALNTLNDETDGSLIETGEREELCDLFCVVAEKADIDPKKYGDGEGPASEWRDW